ncbi:hypothetical protein CI109_106460 [Kwoniella shandongensis]|uniref:Uncharacterized protein n=1 Tax=Kwoniella shandongensis TaxID=1734106 RepID=A0A5M6C5Y8_9TREE|nr:uncharacterized protein CI109_002642 [Kwoniella shandongensis]KAA5528885.1 hypothetical protein CI109_002642 [Kwoniella shandongensis]
MPDQANSILILHSPHFDPSSFISRLIDVPSQDFSDTETTKWTIDNKYYTAQVELHTLPINRTGLDNELLKGWNDVDVVLYLFEGKAPKTLPPTLIKLLAEPRDIALAVRALPTSTSQSSDITGHNLEDANENDPKANDAEQTEVVEGVDEGESLTELFEEIGMEFVDEVNPLTEEDDERPLPPLEIVRQTLHTHIWPSMKRKPLHSSSQLPATSSSSSGSTSPSATSPQHASFPITFNDPSSSNVLEDSGSAVAFPGLDELRAEIYKSQFEDIDRLDALIDGGGGQPGDEEYARLEDWLEDEDEEFEPGNIASSAQEVEEGDWLEVDDRKFEPTPPATHQARMGDSLVEGDAVEGGSIDPEDDGQPSLGDDTGGDQALQRGEDESDSQDLGFEDDFTDFQSAPLRGQGTEAAQTHALDPTPLLMHVQSVRAELAEVANEDERRVRAGREVKLILESLGMGDVGDLGDDLDDELDFGPGGI